MTDSPKSANMAREIQRLRRKVDAFDRKLKSANGARKVRDLPVAIIHGSCSPTGPDDAVILWDPATLPDGWEIGDPTPFFPGTIAVSTSIDVPASIDGTALFAPEPGLYTARISSVTLTGSATGVIALVWQPSGPPALLGLGGPTGGDIGDLSVFSGFGGGTTELGPGVPVLAAPIADTFDPGTHIDIELWTFRMHSYDDYN